MTNKILEQIRLEEAEKLGYKKLEDFELHCAVGHKVFNSFNNCERCDRKKIDYPEVLEQIQKKRK